MVGDGPLGDKLVGVKGCMAFNLSSMDRIRVVVGALMKSFGTARYHSQLQHDNVHTRTGS